MLNPWEVQAAFPSGVIGDTVANLAAAAASELHEHSVMYPEFAEVAAEEGFADISRSFRAIASVEKQHEKRYNELLANARGARRTGRTSDSDRTAGSVVAERRPNT